MPHPSLPFIFYDVKNMRFEKFSEILGRDSDVNVVVYLYRDANAVAFADTKATGKDDLVLNAVFLYRPLKKLDDILRALKMAGRSYANLYYKHILYLRQNGIVKEFGDGIGGYGIKLVVHGNAHALLALSHTKRAAKLNLLTKVVLCNKILKSLNYLTRALDVAGGSDTNCNFKHNIYLS